MARSQRLRLADLRAAFRLVGEVRELGADPLAWRHHLANELARLVHARVVAAVENCQATRIVTDQSPAGIVDIGWGDDSERQIFLHYLASGGDNAPYLKNVIALATRRPFFTVSRRRLVTDRTWYNSEHVNESRRGSRVDDFIYSVFSLPVGRAHYLGLHRPWGERGFDDAARRLIHLVHAELGQFWSGVGANADPFPGLTRRQRQTLELLLHGASEKEAARRLGLSVNTLHRHVTDLHRRLKVSSRGELLAECHRRLRWQSFRPRLCADSLVFNRPSLPREPS